MTQRYTTYFQMALVAVVTTGEQLRLMMESLNYEILLEQDTWMQSVLIAPGLSQN